MANDFLTFAADPAADVMTQANYANVSSTFRVLGFATGTALTPQVNKVWRQASLISTMIANFSAYQTGHDMLDDGSTTGMNNLQATFTLAVQNAAIAAIGTGYLPLGGGTLTGPLVIRSGGAQLDIIAPAGAPAQIFLDSPAGQYTTLFARTNLLNRWQVLFSDNTPETGANAGSNFSISRYADNGTSYLGTPLSISRATGVVNFAQPPTLNGSPLPYLSIGGGNLSGNLTFSAGVGISYAVGGYTHAHEFGWDGSEILSWVDGNYVGNLAFQGWVNSVVGGYLPLGGGTLTGALQCNSSLIVNGGAGFRSSVWFANFGDFANFTDGRTRYRQWAGNWWDGWDGQTGNRTWYCAGGQSMFLDAAANFQVTGAIHCNNGRLLSTAPNYAPCIGLWQQNAGAMGMWFDGSNLVWGQVDGGAAPVTSRMWVSTGGQLNVTAGIYASGSIQSANQLYSNGDVIGAGNGSLGGTLWTGLDISVGRNLAVQNVANFYGPGRAMVHSNQPAFGLDFVGNYAMGMVINYAFGAALVFTMMDGGANPTGWLGFLNTVGVWGGAYFQQVSGRALKKNIEPSPEFDSLEAIRAVRTFSYDMKASDTHRDFGFIAEEMAELLPDVVTDYEASPTVDLTALIAHAYRAIQQLAARVDAIA